MTMDAAPGASIVPVGEEPGTALRGQQPAGRPTSGTAALDEALAAVQFLEIEPTTRCNFTCALCCGRTLPQLDLNLETFTAALDTFPGVCHLQLQGEGEPLLHPEFFTMAARACSRGIKVSFISNGSLLTSGNVERILDGQFEKVLVSLESVQEDTFHAIRGGELGEVVAGLDRLRRRRRELGLTRPAIGLAVTVLRRTLGELPAIIALYRKLELDGGISTQPLNPMPGYRSCYPSWLAEEILPAVELDAHMEELRADLVLRAAIDGCSPRRGFFDLLFDGFESGRGRCPWLERAAYVAADGSVTGCCTIKDTASFSFGKVGRVGAPRLLEARAAMAAELGARVPPAACRGCEIAGLALDAGRARSSSDPVEELLALELEYSSVYCSTLALQRDVATRLAPRLAELGCPVPSLSEGSPESGRVAELEGEREHLLAALAEVRAEVAALHRSRSWRLTAPLRAGYELLRRRRS